MSQNLTLFASSDFEPESDIAERKQSWSVECLKSLAAFANTRGGTLWVGIHDDGHTTGWLGDGREQERISNQILDGLHRLPAEMNVQTRDGMPVLQIHMARAASPVAYHGRYYCRVENTTREVPEAELPRFLLERTGSTWDELSSDFGVDAISSKTIADFRVLAYERLPGISPSDTTSIMLDKLDLAEANGKLKRAGMLLFGENPQRMVRSGYVQIARLNDEVTFLDEKTITGNLFTQLEQTMQAIRGYVFVRYDIPKNPIGISALQDLQRHEVWEFPYDAVREAVLNALIHRDYTSVGRIQIRVFNDRIVISNPGALPETLRVSDLYESHNSFPRNPAIALTVYYTKFIEKWGTGTLRMQDACIKEGAPIPEFESKPLEFIVTLRKSRNLSGRNGTLSDDDESKVIALAASKGDAGISRAEVMALLDYDAQAASNLLLRLRRRHQLAQIGTRRWTRYTLPKL